MWSARSGDFVLPPAGARTCEANHREVEGGHWAQCTRLRRCKEEFLVRDKELAHIHTRTKIWQHTEISNLKKFEQIELRAKLLDYFLWSNKSYQSSQEVNSILYWWLNSVDLAIKFSRIGWYLTNRKQWVIFCTSDWFRVILCQIFENWVILCLRSFNPSITHISFHSTSKYISCHRNENPSCRICSGISVRYLLDTLHFDAFSILARFIIPVGSSTYLS